jgi:hypothetical protein
MGNKAKLLAGGSLPPAIGDNNPHYTAALAVASTIGRNFKTLRENKRALGRSLVLAIAVEGFDRKAAIIDAKNRMGWAKMEKDEKNNASVLFNAVTTCIDAWPHLEPEVKTAFTAGELLVSTLAATIKAADKARETAEAEAARASEGESGDDTTPTPTSEPEVQDRSDAILAIIPLFGEDAVLTDNEQAALALLLDAVTAYELRVATPPTVAEAA